MSQAGYVECPSANVKLPIRLSLRSGTFSCAYAGVVYEDTQLQGLKDKVLQAIKQTYALAWTPIIELTLSVPVHRSQETTSFSLTRVRKYVARHQNLGYKQVHWSATPDGRFANSRPFPWPAEEEFAIPTGVEGYGKQTMYLPYSDALWQQLEEIEQYLLLAARKLKRGFGSVEQVGATLALCRSLFDHFATRGELPEDEGE
ncbi:MAG: hypothetical protein ACRDIV_17565 [Ktedonobacteraceae bacterium]